MGLLFQTNRRLSEFSTFGIGGPILYFAEAKTIEEMQEALFFAQKEKLPFLVLGKGSNSLFHDRGFCGVAVLNRIDFCDWEERSVSVGSGYSFSLLGVQTARKNLSGLEFASGIPASVGGAVFMNAGANGMETCDVLSSVDYLHFDGTRKQYLRKEQLFAYRKSPFQAMEGVILSASFDLTPLEGARQKQLQIIDYRMKTQPLKEKSAGCIFRNPGNGVSAGALIDQCGLKGFQLGGAKISEVHANFIVNAQQALAQDVLDLIEEVQKKVYEQTGVHLEPEIRVVSDGKE